LYIWLQIGRIYPGPVIEEAVKDPKTNQQEIVEIGKPQQIFSDSRSEPGTYKTPVGRTSFIHGQTTQHSREAANLRGPMPELGLNHQSRAGHCTTSERPESEARTANTFY
jgi:hypothetical protein